MLNRLDHFTNAINNELRLVNLNVMTALLGNDLPTLRREFDEIELQTRPSPLLLNRRPTERSCSSEVAASSAGSGGLPPYNP